MIYTQKYWPKALLKKKDPGPEEKVFFLKILGCREEGLMGPPSGLRPFYSFSTPLIKIERKRGKGSFWSRTKKTRRIGVWGGGIGGRSTKPGRLREKLRRDYVLLKHIGRFFFVHNGKSLVSVAVQKKMLGHKFGEFAITRQRPVHKKKKRERA